MDGTSMRPGVRSECKLRAVVVVAFPKYERNGRALRRMRRAVPIAENQKRRGMAPSGDFVFDALSGTKNVSHQTLALNYKMVHSQLSPTGQSAHWQQQSWRNRT